jgi:hypothetical protein
MSSIKNSNAQAILDAYHRRDFNALSQMNLETPIDSDGNTIVHVMAKALDKQGFEELKKDNPNCLSYDVINKQNNKTSDAPIHSALRTVYSNNSSGHAFITYLIDELGAKPNIPNRDGWIISITPNSKNNMSSDTKNQQAMSRSMNQQSLQQSSISKSNSGLLNDDVMKTIREATKSGNFNLGESGNGSAGCSSGNTSSNTASSNSSSVINFIQKLTDHYTAKQVGGFSGTRTVKGVLSDFEYNSNSITEDGENDSFSNIRNRKKLMTDFESLMNFDRVKLDPKAMEAYKDILEKIKKVLNITDDETARLYRSALKITLTRQNPELRKRENDAIKIKEMEKILENEAKAKKMLNEIDIEEIKKYMNEQREKAIANAQTKRTFRGQENNTTSDENSDSKPKKPARREPVSETSEEKPKEKKSKPTTSAKGKKVAENGYLMSEEIIFSPHY